MEDVNLHVYLAMLRYVFTLTFTLGRHFTLPTAGKGKPAGVHIGTACPSTWLAFHVHTSSGGCICRELCTHQSSLGLPSLKLNVSWGGKEICSSVTSVPSMLSVFDLVPPADASTPPTTAILAAAQCTCGTMHVRKIAVCLQA